MTKRQRVRLAEALRSAARLDDWAVTPDAMVYRRSRWWIYGYFIDRSSSADVAYCHVVVHFAGWPRETFWYLGDRVGRSWGSDEGAALATACLREQPPPEPFDDERLRARIGDREYFAGVSGLVRVVAGDVTSARRWLQQALALGRPEWLRTRFLQAVLAQLDDGDLAAAQAQLEAARLATFAELDGAP